MKEIRFYYFKNKEFVTSLSKLLEKILKNFLRIVLVVKDEAQRLSINDQLWTVGQQSFVPHGTLEDPPSLRHLHPIWISCTIEYVNDPNVVIFLRNEIFLPDTISTIKHIIYIVDEDSEEEVNGAEKVRKKYEDEGFLIKNWSRAT